MIRIALTSWLLLSSLAWGDGWQEGNKAFDNGDYTTALRHWLPLAKNGMAEAQFNMALCYSNGWGTSVDHQKARFWLKQAAQQGLAAAQHNLALSYAAGQGGAQNLVGAAHWYKQAALQNLPAAQHNLAMMLLEGKGVSKNASEAVQWLQKAAEQNYALSQFTLGTLYLDGQAVGKDPLLAQKWTLQAAEQGLPAAQHNLATLYLNQSDEKQAAFWYTAASQQGYPESQAVLGRLYQVGKGVERDLLQAYFWTALARQETPPGEKLSALQQRLDQLQAILRPHELDQAKELVRSWSSAQESKP